jgi:hypothetical protein
MEDTMTEPIGPQTTISFGQTQTPKDIEKDIGFVSDVQKENYQIVLKAGDLLAKKGMRLTPELPPPSQVTAEQLGNAVSRFDTSSGQLSLGLTAIFQLLHETAVTLKKAHKEARSAAREAEQDKLQAAADKIRSAAALAFAAGVASGAMQIASGVISGVGAIRASATLKGMKGNTSLTAAKGVKAKLTALKNRAGGVTKTSQEAASLSMDSRVALSRAQMEKWSAAAQATQGMGKILESALQYFSKLEEANKAEIEAEASKLRYLVQDQDELVKNANEWEQDVRRKLAEIVNLNNQVMSRIFQV